ncbi:MAG: ABC transporter ATP-binding protein [Actinomycetota bacterium]|nr:ABC transporter ATP-binding protein [Actinomycetota bacterium]
MIEVDRLSKRFGSVHALRSVSFALGDAERLCILGPNGSGKTTLVRLIAGISRPTSGHVTIDEAEPRDARRWIGYAGHESYLYPFLSLSENLRMFADLYDVPPERVAESLEIFDLSAKAEALASSLSRGQTQRASLARALLHSPRYVILDEPFAGLDDASTQKMLRLLDSTPCTTIVVTHDLELASKIAPRSIRLDEGRMT